MRIESLLSEIQALSIRKGFETTKEKNLNICKFLIQLNNWNRVHNLTGHDENKALIENHVFDAWSALSPLKKKFIRAQIPLHLLLM